MEEVKQDLEQGGPQPAGPDRGLEWHVKELQAGNATLLSNLSKLYHIDHSNCW